MDGFTIDALLVSYPSPVVNSVNNLRQIIHQAVPRVKEKANPGWRSISYRDARVGYFCGIFPFENHVDLIFEFGSLLDDPRGILQGDARQTRYLTFHQTGDIEEERIISFILGALNLPPTQDGRRAQLKNE